MSMSNLAIEPHSMGSALFVGFAADVASIVRIVFGREIVGYRYSGQLKRRDRCQLYTANTAVVQKH